MAGIRPKQLARLGEFHLEEAILDVLLEAAHEEECIGGAAISERAGIYREPDSREAGGIAAGNDWVVGGLLTKLRKAGRVERCEQANGRGGWKLTDAEFQRRRDDVRLD
jgi:hypothetical protein